MKKDEYVIITASSKGLGKALALVFADNGYNIILNGRNKDKIQETKKDLDNKGVDVIVIKGDIRDEEVLNNFYNVALDRKTTILINSAAIPCSGKPLDKITDEDIEENVGINLIAQLKLTRRIYNIFLKHGGGTIININSIVGIEPKEFRSIHSSSKWGFKGFSQSLRIEAKKNNIRVMSIYPTRIKTSSEFEYGMEPIDVAKKIFDAYMNNKDDEIIIDGRPPEFRPGYKG